MLWNYPKKSIVDKRVTIKYSKISQNLARDDIFNQLGSVVFIEGKGSQKTGFNLFLGNYNYILCIQNLHKNGLDLSLSQTLLQLELRKPLICLVVLFVSLLDNLGS